MSLEDTPPWLFKRGPSSPRGAGGGGAMAVGSVSYGEVSYAEIAHALEQAFHLSVTVTTLLSEP